VTLEGELIDTVHNEAVTLVDDHPSDSVKKQKRI
jgi:hypothetical protein